MQTINLDISTKGILPPLYAKQGDVGRKVRFVISDGGVPYNIPEDALLSVWYSGSSGEGNYSAIGENSAFIITGNTVTVELIAEMLFVPGGGNLCLIINSADGAQIGLWNLRYVAEEIPGMDSSAAEGHYTALSEVAALAAANAAAAQQAAKEAAQAATALKDVTPESIGALSAIESTEYPGCYYRMVDGEQEWLNPPMEYGVEYRTTERRGGSAVYAVHVNFGALPNVGVKRVNLGYDMRDLVSVSGVAWYRDGHDRSDITEINVTADSIVITTDSDMSELDAYITVKYCK